MDLKYWNISDFLLMKNQQLNLASKGGFRATRKPLRYAPELYYYKFLSCSVSTAMQAEALLPNHELTPEFVTTKQT